MRNSYISMWEIFEWVSTSEFGVHKEVVMNCEVLLASMNWGVVEEGAAIICITGIISHNQVAFKTQ